MKIVTTWPWLSRQILDHNFQQVASFRVFNIDEPIPDSILQEWNTRRKYERKARFSVRQKAMRGITHRSVLAVEFIFKPDATLVIRGEAKP